MTTHSSPRLVSQALDHDTAPDWADVVIVPLPPGDDADARAWSRRVFSMGGAPKVVLALMGLRQLLVPLLGVAPSGRDVFTVDTVVGQEALIVARDRHLDFRCGVGVDHEAGLLRVTTAVWLHGWRGRVYFAPVALLHDPITRAMMVSAVRRAGGGQ